MGCGNFNNFILTGDSKTFILESQTGNTYTPITVMKLVMCGSDGESKGNSFRLFFKKPIDVLSNREYVVSVDIFDYGFFKSITNTGYRVHNSLSLYPIGTTDIDIVEENIYEFPKTPRRNEWITLTTKFKVEDNTGKQQVQFGLLFETDYEFNLDIPIFINNFVYSGADILVQDKIKQNLKIQENFDENFIGGIQKLRIYDRPLTAQEALHNASVENLNITKGGRLIYR